MSNQEIEKVEIRRVSRRPKTEKQMEAIKNKCLDKRMQKIKQKKEKKFKVKKTKTKKNYLKLFKNIKVTKIN